LMSRRYSERKWETIINTNPGLFAFMPPELLTRTMAEAIVKAPDVEFTWARSFYGINHRDFKSSFEKLGYEYPKVLF
jgi:hypothetical protein